MRVTRYVGKLIFTQKDSDDGTSGETTVSVERLSRDEALGLAGVIRCRDCKHYADHEWVMVTDVSDVCHFWADGVKVKPDGFCAWGEVCQ